MADRATIPVQVKLQGYRDQVQSLKHAFENIKVGTALSAQVNAAIRNAQREISSLQKKVTNGVHTQSDIFGINDNVRRIESAIKEFGSLSDGININNIEIPKDVLGQLEDLRKKAVEARAALQDLNGTHYKNMMAGDKGTRVGQILGQDVGAVRQQSSGAIRQKLVQAQISGGKDIEKYRTAKSELDKIKVTDESTLSEYRQKVKKAKDALAANAAALNQYNADIKTANDRIEYIDSKISKLENRSGKGTYGTASAQYLNSKVAEDKNIIATKSAVADTKDQIARQLEDLLPSEPIKTSKKSTAGQKSVMTTFNSEPEQQDPEQMKQGKAARDQLRKHFIASAITNQGINETTNIEKGDIQQFLKNIVSQELQRQIISELKVSPNTEITKELSEQLKEKYAGVIYQKSASSGNKIEDIRAIATLGTPNIPQGAYDKKTKQFTPSAVQASTTYLQEQKAQKAQAAQIAQQTARAKTASATLQAAQAELVSAIKKAAQSYLKQNELDLGNTKISDVKGALVQSLSQSTKNQLLKNNNLFKGGYTADKAIEALKKYGVSADASQLKTRQDYTKKVNQVFSKDSTSNPYQTLLNNTQVFLSALKLDGEKIKQIIGDVQKEASNARKDASNAQADLDAANGQLDLRGKTKQELETEKGQLETQTLPKLKQQAETESKKTKQLQKDQEAAEQQLETAERQNEQAQKFQKTITGLESTIKTITHNVQDAHAIVNEIDAGATQEERQTAQTNAENTQQQYQSAQSAEVQKIKQRAAEGASNASSNAQQLTKQSNQATQAAQDILQANENYQQFTRTLDNFQNRLIGSWTVFNGIGGLIRSAATEIQTLDKAITGIATVTDLSSEDLWNSIGQYTSIAKQYGVTTQGVYQVSQLYYQMGLSTNDVTQMTTQTLKMAKIAGLDYSTATNYMAAALNGFKLEASDAGRVVDTYSALAATAATTTSQLATAMSKTASIAEASGMSLESTSAMLTMMIETTRQAPENLGTAMKSMIARFQKIDENPMGNVDVDGQTTSFNDVDTALRTVGISLTDTSGQMRDLDDVIFELSGKWDTLDRNTQKWIANEAAGSRQQSRFIALMSDNSRLTELYNTAMNSQDAAMVQQAKTMDSVETKITNLKNTFTQFYTSMGANGEVAKTFLDVVQTIADKFNGGIPGIATAATQITTFAQSIRAAFNIMKSMGSLLNTGSLGGVRNGGLLATVGAKIGTNIYNQRKKNVNKVPGFVAPQKSSPNGLWETLTGGKNAAEKIASVTADQIKERTNLLIEESQDKKKFDQQELLAKQQAKSRGATHTQHMYTPSKEQQQQMRAEAIKDLTGIDVQSQLKSIQTKIKEQEASGKTPSTNLTNLQDKLQKVLQGDQNATKQLLNGTSQAVKQQYGVVNAFQKYGAQIQLAGQIFQVAANGLLQVWKDTYNKDQHTVAQNRQFEGALTATQGGISALSGALSGAAMGAAGGIPGIFTGAIGGALPGLIQSLGGLSQALTGPTQQELDQQASNDKVKAVEAKSEVTTLENFKTRLKSLGDSMYDSSDSLQKYYDEVQKLGESYPQLIDKYNSEGQAISYTESALDALIAKRQAEAASAEKQAATSGLKATANARDQLIANITGTADNRASSNLGLASLSQFLISVGEDKPQNKNITYKEALKQVLTNSENMVRGGYDLNNVNAQYRFLTGQEQIDLAPIIRTINQTSDNKQVQAYFGNKQVLTTASSIEDINKFFTNLKAQYTNEDFTYGKKAYYKGTAYDDYEKFIQAIEDDRAALIGYTNQINGYLDTFGYLAVNHATAHRENGTNIKSKYDSYVDTVTQQKQLGNIIQSIATSQNGLNLSENDFEDWVNNGQKKHLNGFATDFTAADYAAFIINQIYGTLQSYINDSTNNISSDVAKQLYSLNFSSLTGKQISELRDTDGYLGQYLKDNEDQLAFTQAAKNFQGQYKTLTGNDYDAQNLQNFNAAEIQYINNSLQQATDMFKDKPNSEKIKTEIADSLTNFSTGFLTYVKTLTSPDDQSAMQRLYSSTDFGDQSSIIDFIYQARQIDSDFAKENNIEINGDEITSFGDLEDAFRANTSATTGGITKTLREKATSLQSALSSYETKLITNTLDGADVDKLKQLGFAESDFESNGNGGYQLVLEAEQTVQKKVDEVLTKSTQFLLTNLQASGDLITDYLEQNQYGANGDNAEKFKGSAEQAAQKLKGGTAWTDLETSQQQALIEWYNGTEAFKTIRQQWINQVKNAGANLIDSSKATVMKSLTSVSTTSQGKFSISEETYKLIQGLDSELAGQFKLNYATGLYEAGSNITESYQTFLETVCKQFGIDSKVITTYFNSLKLPENAIKSQLDTIASGTLSNSEKQSAFEALLSGTASSEQVAQVGTVSGWQSDKMVHETGSNQFGLDNVSLQAIKEFYKGNEQLGAYYSQAVSTENSIASNFNNGLLSGSNYTSLSNSVFGKNFLDYLTAQNAITNTEDGGLKLKEGFDITALAQQWGQQIFSGAPQLRAYYEQQFKNSVATALKSNKAFSSGNVAGVDSVVKDKMSGYKFQTGTDGKYYVNLTGGQKALQYAQDQLTAMQATLGSNTQQFKTWYNTQYPQIIKQALKYDNHNPIQDVLTQVTAQIEGNTKTIYSDADISDAANALAQGTATAAQRALYQAMYGLQDGAFAQNGDTWGLKSTTKQEESSKVASAYRQYLQAQSELNKLQSNSTSSFAQVAHAIEVVNQAEAELAAARAKSASDTQKVAKAYSNQLTASNLLSDASSGKISKSNWDAYLKQDSSTLAGQFLTATKNSFTQIGDSMVWTDLNSSMYESLLNVINNVFKGDDNAQVREYFNKQIKNAILTSLSGGGDIFSSNGVQSGLSADAANMMKSRYGNKYNFDDNKRDINGLYYQVLNDGHNAVEFINDYWDALQQQYRQSGRHAEFAELKNKNYATQLANAAKFDASNMSGIKDMYGAVGNDGSITLGYDTLAQLEQTLGLKLYSFTKSFQQTAEGYTWKYSADEYLAAIDAAIKTAFKNGTLTQQQIDDIYSSDSYLQAMSYAASNRSSGMSAYENITSTSGGSYSDVQNLMKQYGYTIEQFTTLSNGNFALIDSRDIAAARQENASIAEIQNGIQNIREQRQEIYATALKQNKIDGKTTADSIADYFTKTGNVNVKRNLGMTDQALVDSGWIDAKDVTGASVSLYSQGFSNAKGTMAVTVTPIMQDGTVLSPEQLSSYVEDIIDTSNTYLQAKQKDTLELFISGTDVNGQSGVKTIDEAIEREQLLSQAAHDVGQFELDNSDLENQLALAQGIVNMQDARTGIESNINAQVQARLDLLRQQQNQLQFNLEKQQQEAAFTAGKNTDTRWDPALSYASDAASQYKTAFTKVNGQFAINAKAFEQLRNAGLVTTEMYNQFQAAVQAAGNTMLDVNGNMQVSGDSWNQLRENTATGMQKYAEDQAKYWKAVGDALSLQQQLADGNLGGAFSPSEFKMGDFTFEAGTKLLINGETYDSIGDFVAGGLNKFVQANDAKGLAQLMESDLGKALGLDELDLSKVIDKDGNLIKGKDLDNIVDTISEKLRTAFAGKDGLLRLSDFIKLTWGDDADFKIEGDNGAIYKWIDGQLKEMTNLWSFNLTLEGKKVTYTFDASKAHVVAQGTPEIPDADGSPDGNSPTGKITTTTGKTLQQEMSGYTQGQRERLNNLMSSALAKGTNTGTLTFATEMDDGSGNWRQITVDMAELAASAEKLQTAGESGQLAITPQLQQLQGIIESAGGNADTLVKALQTLSTLDLSNCSTLGTALSGLFKDQFIQSAQTINELVTSLQTLSTMQVSGDEDSSSPLAAFFKDINSEQIQAISQGCSVFADALWYLSMVNAQTLQTELQALTQAFNVIDVLKLSLIGIALQTISQGLAQLQSVTAGDAEQITDFLNNLINGTQGQSDGMIAQLEQLYEQLDKVETSLFNSATNAQQTSDGIARLSDAPNVENTIASINKVQQALIKLKALTPLDISVNEVGDAISRTQTIIDNLAAIKDKTVTVTVNYVTTGNPGGLAYGGVGRAIGGRAYANGTGSDISVPQNTFKASDHTLVGQLGPELLVRDGQWSILGQDGAQFTATQPGDIIFDAEKTKKLLSGRGHVRGNAMATGGRVGGPAAASGAAAAYEIAQTWSSLASSLSDILKKGSGGGGGGGGDSAGDASDNEYEMNLERWYNWLKEIEVLEEKINYLQAERKNLTGAEYAESLQKENYLLASQAGVYYDLYTSQQNYRKTLQNDILSNYGQYFSILPDGALQIDYQAMKAATSGNEDLADTLQDLMDTYTDTLSSIYENAQKYQQALADIQQNIKTSQTAYTSMQNEVLKVLKDTYNAEITAKKDALNEMKKADNSYISSLRNSLNQQKRLRNQSNQQDNINELQKKVALLEKDTSGKSAKELANARKQLSAALENSYFNERNDAINDLNNSLKNQQNYYQSEIDALNAANQIKLKNMRLYWAEVEQIVKNSQQNILAFLEGGSSYQNLSALQQQVYMNTWNNNIGVAKAYNTLNGTDWNSVVNNVQQNSYAYHKDNVVNAGVPTNDANKGSTKHYKWQIRSIKNGALYNSAASVGGYTTNSAAAAGLKNFWNAIPGKAATKRKLWVNSIKAYKTGGIVDYTGIAQVDGTKSKPEAFLNANTTAEMTEYAKVMSSVDLNQLANVLEKLGNFEEVNNDNGTTIGDINITVESGVVQSTTQATALGKSVAEELMSIARQSGTLSIKRR